MTSTVKMARRLAIAYAVPFVVVLTQSSCGSPTVADGLAPPDPTEVTSVAVSPKADTTTVGRPVQFHADARNALGDSVPDGVDWAATGGTITADGLFLSQTSGAFKVAAKGRGKRLVGDTATVVVLALPVTLTAVILTPATTTLQPGASQPFAVSGQWSDGSTTAPAVTYSATGGTITAAGLYTAGSTAGSFRVIAVQQGGTLADTSAVTITVPVATLTSLTLSPATASLQTGTTRQFSVAGTWSDGSTTAPAVTYSATGGTITAGGLYTAGSTAGSFRVIAVQQGGTLADTSVVTLTAPVLTQVILIPATASLQAGTTRQFSAAGTWSDGSTTAPAVTYSATGGTITAGGLYTAGSTAGSFRVIAVLQGGTLADTAAVTITAPTPTLTRVILTPATASLATAGTQQFTVSGQWSDGSTTAPAVTYSATGGTITAAGLYTAGGTAGSFRVIAVQQGGTLADTSAVTITAPAPTLTSLTLSPASASLQTGTTRQFSVAGTWSDGSTTTPAVTYSATGGTITAAGLYTAGSTAGSFRVIAVQQGGTLADTSAVTITASTATLTSLSLTPASASLQTGTTQQFSVAGTWSDGSTTTPAVTYSATGGTITAAGLYTAGSTVGSFRVIAVQQGGTLADTSAVTITPPATGANPNEPAGYTRISDQTGDAVTADGWQVATGSVTVATDATAPTSPSSVLRVTYPAGWSAGYTPGAIDRSLPGRTSVYYRITFKHSANFQGQSSGTNKLGYVWIHNNPSVFLSAEGMGTGNLVAHVRLQNVPDSRDHLVPNQGPSGVISRGVWHTWEVQLISNTPGTANGIVRAWLDGVLITQYTDVQFAGAGQGNTWDLISIYPIWGGVGGTVTNTMTLDFDDFYVSGP
jgi:hypothetical protein